MRTAVIFGVTGQDGSFLSELLLAKGYNVIGVARRVSVDTTGRLTAAKANKNFVLTQGDVTDPLCVYRLIDEHCNFDERLEVFNLAAQSHVGVSFDQPSLTTDVVYKGCLNILEAIRDLYRKWGRLDIRFYQASSSEMFGSSKTCGAVTSDGARIRGPVTFPDDVIERGARPVCFQDEQTPMLPNSPYAVAKLAAHNLIRIYREAYGIFACSGILFNHESPRRGDTFVTRKISLWTANLYHQLKRHFPGWPHNGSAEKLLKDKSELRISLGNLESRRDWGYAGDYVEAMWLMLQQEKPDDFVIATGETHSVREFLNEALEVIGVPAGIPFDVVVNHDASLLRPSEVPFLCGNSDKAKSQLGWTPKVTFKQLVRRMVYHDIGHAVA